MQQSNRELWSAFLAIIAITFLYLFLVINLGEIPGASDLFGHGIGIVGFIFMLMTESLYSLRKRRRTAKWGKMSNWLQFHIFTGLVGPYMVLLHSSWKFNGLAGLVMLFTIIIVISGVIGRYIYTSVPRNLDGIEIEAAELQQRIGLLDNELQGWMATHSKEFQKLSTSIALEPVSSGTGLIFGRLFDDWKVRVKWWWSSRRFDKEARIHAKQLNGMIRRERLLRRQLSSIALTRRMLGLWHQIHIPIGMVLFTAAFIHVVAAIYYATLLH